MNPPCAIRLATEADLPAMNDIYNYFVQHCTCTYQEHPETLEARRLWYQHHGGLHPLTVAETGGQVVGWGSLSLYHFRSGFRHTVEDSLYVHHQHHRRGIGSQLLEDLIRRARSIGYHAVMAGIDSEQTASVALHTRFGFEQGGRTKQVGHKFGRWLDVLHLELLLDTPLTVGGAVAAPGVAAGTAGFGRGNTTR